MAVITEIAGIILIVALVLIFAKWVMGVIS